MIVPCCGNVFHNYILHNYCNVEVVNIDLQDETNSWLPINVSDCREYISTKLINHTSALLLSWIDYEALGVYLIEHFRGNLIISIGNYDKHKILIICSN